MPDAQAFTESHREASKLPHEFVQIRHSTADAKAFSDLVASCLRAWRLGAEALSNVEATGFSATGLRPILTTAGAALFPTIPPEDANVTRSPVVTDVTELLALAVIAHRHREMRFPYPRVLHKELRDLQHHGIDFIGIRGAAPDQRLVLVEVMASVEAAHPPSTVRDHRVQLLDETLNAVPPKRLLDDVMTVHDECAEDGDKEFFNAVIAALVGDAADGVPAVSAVAVLVRPSGLSDRADWKPFFDTADDFAAASVPATLLFLCVECDTTFTGLLRKIADACKPEPPDEDGKP